MTKGRIVPSKPKLLIHADAGIDTGFANLTHNLIEQLHKRYDIDVLAINYRGDPHPIQKLARLWSPTALVPDDHYGHTRFETLINMLEPDIILMINDPWVLAPFAELLAKTKAKKVAYVPVDAQNIKKEWIEPLNVFDKVVPYTAFADRELVRGGLNKSTVVIPHGINKALYHPIDQKVARKMSNIQDDWFVVLNLDRNQWRKRIDLSMYYFAKWVHLTDKPDNVKFYYHGAVRDEGWDIVQLARTFGIEDRLILTSLDLNPAHGLPVELMHYVYNVADVKISTTLGEGWGFSTHEAMACKIATLAPRSSALAEWPNGGVEYIEINEIPVFNTKGLNTEGKVPDMRSALQKLELLYNDNEYRKSLANAGYKIATDPKYEWKNIGIQWDMLFKEVLNG